MKNILLSGSTGFLGGYLKKYYESLNYNVITIGRRNSDIKYDFANGILTSALVEKIKSEDIDLFIHAAASNELYCKPEDILCYRVNVEGVKCALEMCRRSCINGFVYISTCHIYGRLVGNITESIVPKPINDYGLSHLLAEQLVQMYSRNYDLETLIVRPSNIYSVPQTNINRWTLVPNCFCKDVFENKKLVINTSGKQMRNFVHIKSVADDILMFKNCNNVINSYGNEVLSIRDVAYKVLEVAKNKFGIEAVLNIEEEMHETFDFAYTSNFFERKNEVAIDDVINDVFRYLFGK